MTDYVIAQLSDMHLRSDIYQNHEGANPYNNLILVLDFLFLHQDKYQAILISGDLVQDINADTYALLNNTVARYNWQIPFICIAGNHDDLSLMRGHLTASVFCWQWPIVIGGWSLVHVDSVLPKQAKGYISANTIMQLPAITTPFVLVVLHHHLQPCNSFMDKYIADYDVDFTAWLTSLPSKKYIVHGHIHAKRRYMFNGVNVFACPATSIEYIHDQADFAIGRTTPGFNELVLKQNGDLTVNTIWL